MPMAKEKVEDSLVLDVLDFAKKGYLRDGTSSTTRWTGEDKVIGSISWRVTGGALHLTYTVTRGDGAKTNYSYPVPLARTPATYGGERVWFTCPRCRKRVRKLYLPPSGGRFLCRDCHGLSYLSRQKRRSAEAKAWERLPKLEKDLETLPMSSRRWRKTYAETEELVASLKGIDPLDGAPRRLPKGPMPKRSPGRPSKRDLRERAKAEREAARGTMVKRPRGRPRLKRIYTRRKPLLLSERKGDMEGYCVKCRDRRELKDPKPVTLSNGRPAIQGTCPVCATKVTRIVKAG